MTLVSVAARDASLAMSYGSSKGSLAPTTLEVALFNGDPADGGAELTGTGGYVRVTLPNNGSTWPSAPSGGQVVSAPVVFPVSTGAWSDDATHWLLLDADTGDEWDSMPLSEVVTVAGAGVIPKPILTVNYIDPTLGA